MTDISLTLLHLSLIPGVSPATVHALYQHAQTVWYGDLQEIYKLSVVSLQKIGFVEKTARAIHTGLRDISMLEREIGLLTKHDISIVTIDDALYPQLLKAIHVPPAVLYVKGALPTKPCIALVGSRQANAYGQRVIDMLIPALVVADVAIVSGGAQGIDTMVHQAVLDHGGITVAVVGTGLLTTYPATNKRLFEKIIESGGAIMSPFALDAGAEPWRFPVRNRIIAGICQATVVVQAAQKSGALITASYALQEGRVVGAVPGPIDDLVSVGCHELLKQGACLVQSADDVLEECGLLGKLMSEVQEGAHQVISNEQSVVVMVPRQELPEASCSDLEGEKQDLLSDRLLRHCRRPISTAALSAKVAHDERDVASTLFELQLSGKVIQDFAGLWRLS